MCYYLNKLSFSSVCPTFFSIVSVFWFTAWLFGVSGMVMIVSGLLLLFFDFSRDALAHESPAGYRHLATSEDTVEGGTGSASSSASSLSTTRASDPRHKHLS